MVMRVSGLASGMNTDDIVKQLMSAHRVPMDKLSQKKQLIEWQRDDYRAMNNKILDFRNAAFDMKLQSSYLTKKVAVSQESALTVRATADANDGQYAVKIDRLAKSASFNTGDLNGAPGDSKTMATLGLSADSTQLKIGGDKGSATIDVKKDMTVAQLVTAVNKETGTTGIKVSYDSTMDRLFFTSSKTGAAANIKMELANGENLNAIFKTGDLSGTAAGFTADSLVGGTGTFEVEMNGTKYNFAITSTTKMGQLVNEMNDKLNDVGVRAYLNAEGKLSFFNNDSAKPLSFSGTNNLTTTLGLDSPTSSSKIDVKGVNAKVQINGVEASYESNTFTFGGMTFTAVQASTTPINVSVSADIDKAVENIKKFVEKYNSLITDINKEVLEKKERSFQPLTDAQRESMSEDQIKKWEERAKNGLLANDSMLSGGLSSLRSIFVQAVKLPGGQEKNLASIGISTFQIAGGEVTGSYLERGKLYIDETKLKQALTDNPNDVAAMFTTDGATAAQDGIATRIYDQVSDLFKKITEKAGVADSVETTFLLGKESRTITQQINNMTKRLQSIEDRYYKQFTAMEKQLTQLNSQSAWLTQQFSTGG